MISSGYGNWAVRLIPERGLRVTAPPNGGRGNARLCGVMSGGRVNEWGVSWGAGKSEAKRS